MVIVDCPWCEGPVVLASPEAFRCDGCRVEVELDPAPVVAVAATEVALAA